MIRATTPIHIFELPFECSTYISKCRVTYSQCGKTVVEKTEADVTYEDKTMRVQLTQADTKAFTCDALVKVQVRCLSTGGQVVASDIYTLRVADVLNDEVL